MKKTLFSYLLVTITTCSYLVAMPAYRGAIQKQLSTGETITLYLHGDQYFHYFADEQGQWYEETADGSFVKTQTLTQEQVRQKRLSSNRYRIVQEVQKATPINPAQRGVVIMANFSDKSFQSKNTSESLNEMWNGEDYTYNGATGSIGKYFAEQSMGQYTPEFDLFGPVDLPEELEFYGKNGSDGEDQHIDSLIIQSCRLAKAKYGIDFSKYDADNDGFIDFVIVLYPGYGEASGASSNTIWPHMYYMYQAYEINQSFDGKKLDVYACFNELSGTRGTTRDGIGTACHEFSHVLGLPDLYVTDDNATHKTMGEWDILDYGPYNNKGRTPPAYSAYERFFMGWLKPDIITENGAYTLNELQSSNKAYLISSTGKHNLKGNDPNPTTFFLLENRQLVGSDAYLPGHGMLITKIAYSYSKWFYNTVNNNGSKMGVDLIEADGSAPSYTGRDNGYMGKATDAFPAGSDHYTAFTYNITNITEQDGVISFNVGGGTALEDLLDNNEQVVGIYDILGRMQPTTDINALTQGVYIVRTTNTTKKIAIE